MSTAEFWRWDFACKKCETPYRIFTNSLGCRPLGFHCMKCDSENHYPVLPAAADLLESKQ